MYQADFTALPDVHETVLDTSAAVSNLWFTSSERMLALTAESLQDAVTDSATAVRAFAGIATMAPLREIWGDLSSSMVEKAIAYGRGMRDIAIQIQDEFARVAVDAWRVPVLASPSASPWPGILADALVRKPTKESQSEPARAASDRRSA